MAAANEVVFNYRANTKAFKDAIAELPKAARIQHQKTYNALQAATIKAEKENKKLKKALEETKNRGTDALESVKKIAMGVGGPFSELAGMTEDLGEGLGGIAGKAGLAVAAFAALAFAGYKLGETLFGIMNSADEAIDRLSQIQGINPVSGSAIAAVQDYEQAQLRLEAATLRVKVALAEQLSPYLTGIINATAGVINITVDLFEAMNELAEATTGASLTTNMLESSISAIFGPTAGLVVEVMNWTGATEKLNDVLSKSSQQLVDTANQTGRFSSEVKSAIEQWDDMVESMGVPPDEAALNKEIKKLEEIFEINKKTRLASGEWDELEAIQQGKILALRIATLRQQFLSNQAEGDGIGLTHAGISAIDKKAQAIEQLAGIASRANMSLLSGEERLQAEYEQEMALIEKLGETGADTTAAREAVTKKYHAALDRLREEGLNKQLNVLEQINQISNDGYSDRLRSSQDVQDAIDKENEQYQEQLQQLEEIRKANPNDPKILSEVEAKLKSLNEWHTKNTEELTKQKGILGGLEAIDKMADGWEVVEGFTSGATANLAALSGELTGSIQPTMINIMEGFKESALSGVSAIAEAVGSVAGMIGEYYEEQQAIAEERIQASNDRLDKLGERRKMWEERLRKIHSQDHKMRSGWTEEEIRQKLEGIDAQVNAEKKQRREYQKQAKRAWMAQKAAAMTEVAMNTAVAVMSAMKLPFPANLIAAGAVSTLGAVQLGIVASQKPPKFHTGTSMIAPRLANDEVPIIVRTGEAVVNQRGAEILGRDTIEDANAGRPVGGGGNTFIIQIGDEEIENFIVRAMGSVEGRKMIRAGSGKQLGRRSK